LFYQLREEWSVPWPMATLICALVIAPVMGLALERLAAGLTHASTAAKVVGMVGLLVGVQQLLTARYGADTRSFKPLFPQHVLSLGSINVGVDQITTFAVGVGLTAILSAILLRTRIGTAMRGVVDDADLLSLAGT